MKNSFCKCIRASKDFRVETNSLGITWAIRNAILSASLGDSDSWLAILNSDFHSWVHSESEGQRQRRYCSAEKTCCGARKIDFSTCQIFAPRNGKCGFWRILLSCLGENFLRLINTSVHAWSRKRDTIVFVDNHRVSVLGPRPQWLRFSFLVLIQFAGMRTKSCCLQPFFLHLFCQ